MNCKTMSAYNRPLISIIIAVFNGEKTLNCTIESLISQSYKHIQLIIVDGASTDRTVDIIRNNMSSIDHFISEPDSGIYDAWNKGLKKARGEWVAFLGAGDIYLSSALENYVKFICDNNFYDVDLISSQVELIENGLPIKVIGKRWDWSIFRRYMNIAHVGALHNINLFKKYGNFNSTYKICGDYEFLLRANNELNAKFIKLTTAQMLSGGVSSGLHSLWEACKAKATSGRLNGLICLFDLSVAFIKYNIKILHFRLCKKYG